MIPNAQNAQIPDAKLRDYLLSSQHPVGRFKAQFFLALGFSPSDVEPLRAELLRIATDSEESTSVASPHGTKVIARGTIASPTGRQASVLTVWMFRPGSPDPRFVTAYPDP